MESEQAGGDRDPEVESPSPVDSSPSDRSPIVRTGHDGIALVIAGIVAAIMTVAFVIGAESIFPVPASNEPSKVSSTSATEPVADTPAAPTEATTEKPAASKEEKPAEEKPPDSKPAESSSPESSASAARIVRPAHGTALLLLSTTLIHASSEQASDASSSDSGVSIFSRISFLIKLVVLVCLGTLCGLVVLGAMALRQDRPLGNPRSAFCRLFACCWLATLSLLVPFQVEWLLSIVHYLVAAIIFWIVSMVWFNLTPRLASVLLGGTMALLAAMALGARLVVWTTWT